MGGASNTNPGPRVNTDAFQAAILANPADDTPRLIYADWLTERGNVHGELIVLQCTRTRLEREGRRATAEYRRVFRREKEIIAAIAREPFDRRPVNVIGLARGLLTHAQSVDQTTIRTKWGQWYGRWPLETLGFRKDVKVGDVAWVAKQPSGLTAIGVQTPTGGLALDPKALAQLQLSEDDDELVWPVESAPNPRVKAAIQRIHFNSAGPALARFTHELPPGLLEISFMGADLPMAKAIATRLPNLQKLSGWLEPNIALAFLEQLAAPKLRNFALQGYQKKTFDAEGSRRLAASALLPQLTNLIADVPLDVVLATALAERAPSLEVLSPGAGLANEGFLAFAASDLPRRLKWLSLRNERNRVPALVPLAAAPFARIESLTLEGFRIDDDTASALANNAGLAQLVDLKLVACQMKPTAAAILADSPHLGALLEPKFIHCRLFHETMQTLTARWTDASFTQDV